MKERELFIGGPQDGRMIAVLHGDTAYSHVGELPSRSGGQPSPEVQRTSYRRELFAVGTRRIGIWVHDEMTTEDAVLKLISQYASE